jgi:hypothetical protein
MQQLGMKLEKRAVWADRRRLKPALACICSAGPGRSIAAMVRGFSVALLTGRTSLQYVEHFGETPSVTALNAKSAQR